jgi:hypothetical protein
VLRRIFGPKRDEVTGEWRRLDNEELHYLCCSPIITRVIKSRRRWAGQVACMGNRTCIQDIGKENRRKDTLGTSRRRWKNNIKINLHEIRRRGAWTKSVWLRLRADGGML